MKKIFSLGLLIVLSQHLFSQKITRQQYIDTYKEIAMGKMREFGIPASITLAQGILESGNGNSTLAIKANNHFGIKCHNNWDGKRIYHDDDKKNECFRKYKNAEESYYDHSLFLTSSSRYDFLFKLKPDDYKGWAKGLKKAGYATSNSYASSLIRIIEENELYRYDKLVLKGEIKHTSKERLSSDKNIGGKKIYTNNRIKYVVVEEGETVDDISRSLGLFTWEIAKYNEFFERGSQQIVTGQKLYIQPKRGKAARDFKTHVVKSGETLYDISQLYGIKLSKLKKLNQLDDNTAIQTGQELQLRKKLKVNQPKSKKFKVEKMVQPEKKVDSIKEQKVEIYFDPD